MQGVPGPKVNKKKSIIYTKKTIQTFDLHILTSADSNRVTEASVEKSAHRE